MRIRNSYAGVVVALASVVVVAAFSGCGKKDAGSPASSGSSKAAPNTTSKATAPENSKDSAATDSKPVPVAATGDMWQQLRVKQKALKSYRMSMNMDGHNMTQSLKFSEGKPQRMKMTTPDGGWVLILMDKDTQYMMKPGEKAAMKMSLNGQGTKMSSQGMDFDKLKKQAPKISDDTLEGKPSWKLTMGKDAVWIDKDFGLLRQAKGNEKTVKFAYDHINSVPESDFELPAGTKVIDMAEMMKRMPKGAPGAAPAMPKAGR